MKDIGDTLKTKLGDAATRVPTRSIPDLLLRLLAPFNAEIRPFARDLGYAKKTSNEKARRMLNWTPRDPNEAILAAAESMVRKGLIEA
jgi:hypothetical protein